MELWVRQDVNDPNGESFIAGHGVDGNVGETFRLSTGSFSNLFVSISGSDFFRPASLTLNQLHHLAVTVAGGMVTLNLDGAAVGSQAMTFNTLTDHFYIGRFGAAFNDQQFLQRRVDEVTVYNRERDAE